MPTQKSDETKLKDDLPSAKGLFKMTSFLYWQPKEIDTYLFTDQDTSSPHLYF